MAMALRALVHLKNLPKETLLSRNAIFRTVARQSSVYEPDYLDALKPKYPLHDTLNFQMKGYDYTILENYQKFIHNIAETLELDVSECWASPPKLMNVQRFKIQSAVVDAEYKLSMYERNLQISDLLAPSYSTFLRIIVSALPEGVTLNVLEHDEEQEELRYVPDRDLLDLKAQLDEMGGPTLQKKR